METLLLIFKMQCGPNINDDPKIPDTWWEFTAASASLERIQFLNGPRDSAENQQAQCPQWIDVSQCTV